MTAVMKKFDEEVLGILRRSKIEDGRVLKLPPERLAADVYKRVNRAIELLGGKWTGRKVQAHVFESDPTQRLAELLETGKTRDEKQTDNFFETPDSVADRLVQIADIKLTHRVLEPSAGRGAIVKAVKRVCVANVVAIEQNSKFERELGECANRVLIADFLGEAPVRCYDRIVANPPFSKGRDIAHIRYMHEWLADGGLIVSVASSGVMDGATRKTIEFREWVREIGGDLIPLGSGAFKASGTNVNTCIVVIPRKVSP